MPIPSASASYSLLHAYSEILASPAEDNPSFRTFSAVILVTSFQLFAENV